MYGHRRTCYWFLYFLCHLIYYSYYHFWVRLNVEWNIMLYIWKRKLFLDFFSLSAIGLVIYWYCPLSLSLSIWWMWIKRKIIIPENVVTANNLDVSAGHKGGKAIQNFWFEQKSSWFWNLEDNGFCWLPLEYNWCLTWSNWLYLTMTFPACFIGYIPPFIFLFIFK